MESYDYPDQQTPQKRGGCGRIFVFVLVLILIFIGYRYLVDRSNYSKGHQSFSQSNCNVAINYYEKIINSWRLVDFADYESLANKEIAECQAYQAAVDKQNSGNPSSAIIYFFDFINTNPNSLLIESSYSSIKSIFLETNADALAAEGLCNQLDTLEEQSLIPQKNQILPELLFECGKTYEGIGYYNQAMDVYDRFIRMYPDHQLSSVVEDALARSIIADARATGAGLIPAPEKSGSTGTSSTVVIIQNDSPERMRIVFSGPDSRIEDLAACSACQTFYGNGPLYCPEKGPIGRYTLPPGNYDVVVQSVSDNSVTPWSGTWELISGDEYYSCFFITETIGP